MNKLANVQSGKVSRSWSQATWVYISASLLTLCTALGKSLTLSNRDYNGISPGAVGRNPGGDATTVSPIVPDTCQGLLSGGSLFEIMRP